MILENVIILTQNISHEIIYGDLYIDDNKIVNIVRKPYTISQKSKVRVVMPALYNLHMHFGETIFRAHCDNMNLFEYLDVSHNTYLLEEWKREEPNIHELSTYVTLIEAIKNGTGYVVGNRSWKQLEKMGMKGLGLYPLVNIDKLHSMYVDFKPDNELAALFIQSVYLVEQQKFEEVAEMLSKYPELKIFIHVCETQWEIKHIYEKYKCSPIEFLDKMNILNENTFLVHSIYMTENDLDIIQKANAKIVLCPVSNMKLKDGRPNIFQFIDRGIMVNVATDGFATNNSASLLEELKVLSLISDQKITSENLLDLVTKNPAQCIYKDNKHGIIDIGCFADIAVFETDICNAYELDMVSNSIIYNYTAFHCMLLMMEGKIYMNDGRVTCIDEENIYIKFSELASNLFAIGKRPSLIKN